MCPQACRLVAKSFEAGNRDSGGCFSPPKEVPGNHQYQNDEQVEKLPALLETAKNNGAKDVRIIEQKEIEKIEPKVFAKAAIYCPTSGIVDSHLLMQYFEANAINHDAVILYRNKVVGIERKNDCYKVIVADDEENHYDFETDVLINCAGLGSGHICELAGIDIDKHRYRIAFSKGIYFRVQKQLGKYPNMLIYPVPNVDGSVGIHTTPDLYGGMRLGPHDYWVDKIDYSLDEAQREHFYNSVKGFLPFIE